MLLQLPFFKIRAYENLKDAWYLRGFPGDSLKEGVFRSLIKVGPLSNSQAYHQFYLFSLEQQH